MTYEQVGLRCPRCGDVIYSNSQHDYEECLCGASHIDGGYAYRKWGGAAGPSPEWVTRSVPDKGGKRDQPWYFHDEPERAALLKGREHGLQPTPS